MSPMPFGIQGITAMQIGLTAIAIGYVSNAFRHSGHHCRARGARACGTAAASLQCLSAFRASLPNPDASRVSGDSQTCLQCLSAFRASLPRGAKLAFSIFFRCLQCLSAFRASLPSEYSSSIIGEVIGSPMPFGIQGITAPPSPSQPSKRGHSVSNAFRHSGHHCLTLSGKSLMTS